MDLDHEGTRAARSLHRQVAATIDLTEARAALDTAAGRHRRRRSQVIGATFAALVLVLGVVVAVTDHGSGTPHVRTTDKVGHKVGSNGLTTGGVNAQTSARGAAVLEAMPSGPIDGRDSWRLPVLAQPQAGLTDGQTVTMYGRGLPAKEAVGVVECAAEADTDGVDACQLEKDQNPFGAVQYAETTAAGTIIQPFVVHRYVDTPSTGKVDCQSAAERCLVAIGSINNYDDSGGSYINFAGAPPFPVPTMAITPAGPYAARQQVAVQGRSLLARRPVRLAECIGTTCQKLVDGTIDADGSFDLSVTVTSAIVDDEHHGPLPCNDRCVLRATGIGVEGASAEPFPPDLALHFTDGASAESSTTIALAPDTTPRTTMPPPATVPLGGSSTTTTTVPDSPPSILPDDPTSTPGS